MKNEIRKIIHIDMDAFFASVEQVVNPKLRGKPLVVGGMPDSRGVVCTCSYEARKFGIHSAMPSYHAYKLCPKAIFIHPNIELYKRFSDVVMGIFRRYSNFVEPLSIDEAYLDVTENNYRIPSATIIAGMIKKDIFTATGLTASAGVSYNKFLAKVATDINKPNGLTVIEPSDAQKFIDNLPVGKFYGVGKVTELKMKKLGISTGADLKQLDLSKMIKLFGKGGEFFYNICRGVDRRPVEIIYERKSYGRELTLEKDVEAKNEVESVFKELIDELSPLLNEKQIEWRTLTLKVKFNDFSTLTRNSTSQNFISVEKYEMLRQALLLLDKINFSKPIRLIGLSVSNIKNDDIPFIQPYLPNFEKIRGY